MKASAEQADRLHRFAHDLRNRLAAMQQAIAQIGEVSAEERDELIAFAEQQYFKAMRGSEQLLDDLEVDRMPVIRDPQPVLLNEVAQRAVSALAHRFERKQQRVDADLSMPITVQGDARMLEDLICALLSNASKFSAEGRAIAISLSREEDRAALTVEDHGIGLDAEDLEQVFTRYAMLKGRSTNGEAQGRSTLARARQWATAHGGGLEARSAGTGTGASFTLRLPLR